MEHDEAEQQESQAALICEHARSCAAIKFEVHLAKREAAAADAAVAAVSQVGTPQLQDKLACMTCTHVHLNLVP